MQGRKPKKTNIVPMTGKRAPRPSPALIARRLCPRGLDKELRREWMRVGSLLADPAVDRLKSHFADTVLEYCRASIRLREIRQFFVDLAAVNKLKRNADVPAHAAIPDLNVDCEHPLGAEIYEIETRNGAQIKMHPLVAQHNETWRQWRSLMMELGLSPASERGLMPGQGDLFSDPAEKYLDGNDAPGSR